MTPRIRLLYAKNTSILLSDTFISHLRHELSPAGHEEVLAHGPGSVPGIPDMSVRQAAFESRADMVLDCGDTAAAR